MTLPPPTARKESSRSRLAQSAAAWKLWSVGSTRTCRQTVRQRGAYSPTAFSLADLVVESEGHPVLGEGVKDGPDGRQSSQHRVSEHPELLHPHAGHVLPHLGRHAGPVPDVAARHLESVVCTGGAGRAGSGPAVEAERAGEGGGVGGAAAARRPNRGHETHRTGPGGHVVKRGEQDWGADQAQTQIPVRIRTSDSKLVFSS